MSAKAETQKWPWWLFAAKVVAMSMALAVVMLVYGRTMFPPSVHAGQSVSYFCQISDAELLADRSHMQGPRVGVQLLTNRQDAGPSEVITARLANFTARNFNSGAEFKIQRYGSTGWQTDASSPDGPWPRSAALLRAGKTRGCYRYVVDKDQPAGRYRFLTLVSTRSESRMHEVPEVAKFSIRDEGG